MFVPFQFLMTGRGRIGLRKPTPSRMGSVQVSRLLTLRLSGKAPSAIPRTFPNIEELDR